MSIISRLCWFLPSAIAGAATAHGYRTYQESKDLPQPQQGSFFTRMYDVALAWKTIYLITDPYTASRHLNTICRISSLESCKQPENEGNEVHKILPPGYLQRVLQQNPQENVPVFVGNEDKNFIYQGSVENLKTQIARRKIVEGHYVRCKEAIVTEMSERDKKKLGYDLLSKQHRFGDVILTDTTNCNSCEIFKIAHLDDIARLAALNELHLDHFISDIPVVVKHDIDTKELPLFAVTTLGRLEPNQKKAIINGKFVSCQFKDVLGVHTRGSTFTNTKAVIVGSTDKKICDEIKEKLV